MRAVREHRAGLGPAVATATAVRVSLVVFSCFPFGVVFYLLESSFTHFSLSGVSLLGLGVVREHKSVSGVLADIV